jgi:YVTN family beta-propeller protein
LRDVDPRIARREARRRQIRRRRLTALAGAAVLLCAVAAAFAWDGVAPEPAPRGSAATAPAGQQPSEPKAGKHSDRTRLALHETLGGDITPKSVVSSGTGLIFAQNMMYRHSVTVYDAKTLALEKTIPDSVRLARFGVKGHPGTVQGAPVEAAFSPDGKHAYVSNYSMYGAGFGPEGDDACTPSSGYDSSFVYRISLQTLEVDDVYRVGSVPKVVAVTPDGRFVLVSNWCTWDLSVISTKAGREVRRVPIGPYPRGIAVPPKGNVAYVAVMGGGDLVRVDLRTWATAHIPIGAGPRALEIDRSGRRIYATLNAEGRVAKLNVRTGRVTKATTGERPRSLALSADGRAMYVVNYDSGTVTKVRTSDLKVLQSIEACSHPIGIAYDAPTRRVWVACYGGALLVYDDRR